MYILQEVPEFRMLLFKMTTFLKGLFISRVSTLLLLRTVVSLKTEEQYLQVKQHSFISFGRLFAHFFFDNKYNIINNQLNRNNAIQS